MHLSPALQEAYTREHLTARQAQRQAQFIAWGPMVFQVSRLMIKFGILDLLRDNIDGLTQAEIVKATGLSDYAVKVLLEASLSIGTVLVDADTDRFTISKTGYFLLTDASTRANLDFNHDVNYEGLFRLEESLREGRPAGLEHFGPWPTVYEGLSELPPQVQHSWFGFDHFYSDGSFPQALRIVLDEMQPRTLLRHYDVIWMSQFLDCFSPEQIVSILSRAAHIMDADSRLCIMETLWDRQKYETAALCLTMTSVYFADIANGNSKMYHTDDLRACVEQAGLQVETIHDNLGLGHSIMVCRVN